MNGNRASTAGIILTSGMPEPLQKRENRKPIARAGLQKMENAEERQAKVALGKVVERARQIKGWSQERLARHVDRDPSQVAKWESGIERALFDLLWAVKPFRRALLLALAEQCSTEEVEMDTVIRVRRV